MLFINVNSDNDYRVFAYLLVGKPGVVQLVLGSRCDIPIPTPTPSC